MGHRKEATQPAASQGRRPMVPQPEESSQERRGGTGCQHVQPREIENISMEYTGIEPVER